MILARSTIFYSIFVFVLQWLCMIVADLFSWWYSGGYGFFASKLFDKLKSTADFFSILDLLKTLFAPFHQISAGGTSSLALDVRLRAFFDRLFSRFFGALIRIFLILVGLVALLVEFGIILVLILARPFLPLVPFLCVFLYLNGVLI